MARKIDLDLGVPGVTVEEDEDFVYLKYCDQVETFSAVGLQNIETLRVAAQNMVLAVAEGKG